MIANGKTNGDKHRFVEELLKADQEHWQAHHAQRARQLEIRTAYGEPSSSYQSGEVDRMNPQPRGIHPYGSDADWHYRNAFNYYLHVERGRAAVRNHPLVEQGINRLIANLRLDCFTLDVDGGDPEVDRAQKDEWAMWTGETQAGQSLCDYEGTRSFQQIARQSFFNRCSDGDILHLPLRSGKLQTWEAHHVRTPYSNSRNFIATSDQNGIVHGAEVRNGQTTAYWVTPYNLKYFQQLSRTGQARRYPVFDPEGNKIAFYLGFKHRFLQRRGISRLSAPQDPMNGFDDLSYANIRSALRNALISYWMEDSGTVSADWGASGTDPDVPQGGDRYSEHVGLGIEAITVEQQGQPAQVFNVPKGKTLQGLSDGTPAQAFFEHSALLLTMLSVNLDIPLMFLLLDGSLVNFHGGRMTFDQVKMRLQQLQKDDIQGLWAPTYEWRTRLRLTPGQPLFDRNLRAAVDRGYNPFRYVFRPKGWPYVKPAEDAAAESLSEERNLRSWRRILSDRGEDADTERKIILNDRATWFRDSLTLAQQIAGENPELQIDVLSLARELRFGGEKSSVTQTQSRQIEMAQQEDQRNAT